VVAPGNQVRQELFTATTPDGIELKLVLLADGRCGILRGGELVLTSTSDGRSVDQLVKRFLEMAGEH
jgi:hypothetical protein